MQQDQSAAALGVIWPAQLDRPSMQRGLNSGIIEKYVQRLSRKLYQTPSIRGNAIAATNLLEAFLKAGSSASYEAFCYPSSLASAGDWFAHSKRLHEKHFKPRSITAIVTGMQQPPNLRAMFIPIPYATENGGLEIGFRMRARQPRALYPIAALYHGLSDTRETYLVDARLLLEHSHECDAVVCTSQASRSAMINKLAQLTERFNVAYKTNRSFRGQIRVIPICVDTDFYVPRNKHKARKQFGISRTAIVVIYLGRISPLKADLHPLLYIFAQICKKKPAREVLLIIAGTIDGQYGEQVRHHAGALKVNHKIRIISHVTEEQKIELLSSADVFISPVDSVQESFGITPIEAMACGVPQIAPAWSGYRDTILHGKTGLLTPAYWAKCHEDLGRDGALAGWDYQQAVISQSVAIDMKTMQSDLETLIENEPLRELMGRASIERAQALFSYRAVAQQYEELWRELAERAGTESSAHNTSFDTLDFDYVFSQYASRIVTEESMVKLTKKYVEDAPVPIPINDETPHGINLVDPTVVARIAAIFVDNEAHGRDARLPVAACLGQSDGKERMELMRHLMWMLKYGYVEIVNQDGCLTRHDESDSNEAL